MHEEFINALSLGTTSVFSLVYGKFCDLTVNRRHKMTNDELANKPLRLAILALARIKLHYAARFRLQYSRFSRRGERGREKGRKRDELMFCRRERDDFFFELAKSTVIIPFVFLLSFAADRCR